jgi:hypothetical protein
MEQKQDLNTPLRPRHPAAPVTATACALRAAFGWSYAALFAAALDTAIAYVIRAAFGWSYAALFAAAPDTATAYVLRAAFGWSYFFYDVTVICDCQL